MSALKMTSVGVQLICEFEGFRNAAYLDVAGVWTIGYGTTRCSGAPVRSGMTCTEEQARAWFHDDLVQFEHGVNSIAPPSILQYQFDACVCFAYNIGVGGFSKSTVGRKVRAGNMATVTEANFVAWNKIRNDHGVLVESAGLTRRRKSEYYLFSTGKIKTQI